MKYPVKMVATSLSVLTAMIMLRPVQSHVISSANLLRSITNCNSDKIMPESRQFGNSQPEASVSKTVKIQRYLLTSFILQVSY